MAISVFGALVLLPAPAMRAQESTAARQAFDARAESWLAVNELDADRRTFTDLSLWPQGYGYVTENVIGETADGVDAEWSMLRPQLDPGSIFPFTVAPLGQDSSIRLDGYYDLQNVRWPGDNGNFIHVTEVGPTSFTFTTLEGHFDGVGATIKFETVVRGGKVFLRQTGYATDINPFTATVAPAGAIYHVWPQQAANLSHELTSQWRSPFPTGERPRIISPMLGSQTVPAVQFALDNRPRRQARRTDELAKRLWDEHNQSMQRLFVDMEQARVTAAAERQQLFNQAEQIWREMEARGRAWEAERKEREGRLQEWNREVEQWRERGTPDTQQRIREMQIEQETLLRERTERQFEEMRWHRESLSKWLDSLQAQSRAAGSAGRVPAAHNYRPPASLVDPAAGSTFPNAAFAARSSRNDFSRASADRTSRTRPASGAGSMSASSSGGGLASSSSSSSSRSRGSGAGSGATSSQASSPSRGSGAGPTSQWRLANDGDTNTEGDVSFDRQGREWICPAPCTDSLPPE